MSHLKISSDGTAFGTSVTVNGVALRTVTSMSFRIDAEGVASATIQVMPDHLELDGVVPVSSSEIAERPRDPDTVRVDAGEYIRAGGDVVCARCGFAYYDHDTVRGYRWLTRLCDGRLVKL